MQKPRFFFSLAYGVTQESEAAAKNYILSKNLYLKHHFTTRVIVKRCFYNFSLA